MTDIKYVVGEPGGIPRRKDMEKNKFTWLAADTFARSKGGKSGGHLEQGKAYDTANYDPDVVAEWVRAGAAKYAATGASKAKAADQEG